MLKTPDDFIPLITPQPHQNPRTLVFRGAELLVREHDLALADESTCHSLAIPGTHIHPIGIWQQFYWRAAWVTKDSPPPPGFAYKILRALFGVMDDQMLGVASRALQIAEWARTHRYCGQCATPMELLVGERCLKCPACAMMAYPRISPAMMVLIKKGDAILLARHVASPTQRFSPLAGFLEAGESIEEAIHREVFEEVGLKIDNLRYFMSQSWPFPHSLMIAFTADYVAGEIVIDQREIAEARWFGPQDALPEYSSAVSISNLLVSANFPSARQ